jgi:plastocyanin
VLSRGPVTRRLARLALACLAVVALSGAAAASAQAPPPKPARVTVNDFYFGPEQVTIKKGASVNWVWSATNSYPHDVHLKSGPSGLKQKGEYSTKTTAVTNAHFKDTFTTPGTYHFICTIHPTQMHLTVVVKK